MKLEYPKLRNLVRMLCVIDAGALSSVAAAVGRAQQTISHSVQALEDELGVQLFERTSRGTFPTRQALMLGERVRTALAHMAEARSAFLNEPGPRRRGHGLRIFELNVRNQLVLIFLSLCKLHEVSRVAADLDIDASAIRKTIRSLEAQLGVRLFDRTPRGLLLPSGFAAIVARQMKLALAEISAGLDELRSAEGTLQGEVVFGAVSYGRFALLPRIISRLRTKHPGLKLTQRIASYDDLEKALTCREADFIVGAQRKPASSDLVAYPLLADRFEILARAGHPLARPERPDTSQYLQYQWILPPRGIPMRAWFDDCLRRRDISAPPASFESADYHLVRDIVADTDAIALALRYEASRDVEQGILCFLPRPEWLGALLDSSVTLHLTCPAGANRSPSAQAFFEEATGVGAELQTCLARRATKAASG